MGYCFLIISEKRRNLGIIGLNTFPGVLSNLQRKGKKRKKKCRPRKREGHEVTRAKRGLTST